MSNPTLTLPPLPTLRWDPHRWVAQIRLPSWPDCRLRYADGTTQLTIQTASKSPTSPTIEQVRAFQNLLENETMLAAQVLHAICAECQRIRLAGTGDEIPEALARQLEEPEELRRLLGLAYVILLDVEKDGFAYMGFDFDCAWDDDHGVGVMTHAGRIVKVGQADTACLGWEDDRAGRG